MTYSGERPTKFGILEDRLDEALATAARHRLTIDTIHFHAGSGWLGDGLPAFEAALARVSPIVSRLMAENPNVRRFTTNVALAAHKRTSFVPIPALAD